VWYRHTTTTVTAATTTNTTTTATLTTITTSSTATTTATTAGERGEIVLRGSERHYFGKWVKETIYLRFSMLPCSACSPFS
jgi:hypothetical protein